MAKIKNILISQPEPERDNNPYRELAKKYKFEILFRKLFKIEGIPALNFRQKRISLLDYSAVIFTSKNAIDHYFRICNEMRVTLPESQKYFCISPSIALYLQKYVMFRKRKIFSGRQHFSELIDVMKKHKEEYFLLPSSDILKPEIPRLLSSNKFKYKRIIFYNTISHDLSDIDISQFDMIVLFSPAGVNSLLKNFPKFKRSNTLVATFGSTTARAAKESGLKIQIQAPTPKAPSMMMALEEYLIKESKAK